VRLRGVELVRVDVPFRRDIGTGAGVHSTRSLLFVRVVAEESEGWGECAALESGTPVDPALDEVEWLHCVAGGKPCHGKVGQVPSTRSRWRLL